MHTQTFCWACRSAASGSIHCWIGCELPRGRLFIADTFKVTNRLNLDYGIRWDYFQAATYKDGLQYNFDPATGDIVVPQAALSKVSPLYPSNIKVDAGEVIPRSEKGNFAPRLTRRLSCQRPNGSSGAYGIFTEFLGPFARAKSAVCFRSRRRISTQFRMGGHCFSSQPVPNNGGYGDNSLPERERLSVGNHQRLHPAVQPHCRTAGPGRGDKAVVRRLAEQRDQLQSEHQQAAAECCSIHGRAPAVSAV